MSGQAEEATADGADRLYRSGGVDSSEPPGDASRSERTAVSSPHEILAASLKSELTAAHERLVTWPEDDSTETMTFWRDGLDEVQEFIDQSRSLLRDCRPLAEAEAGSKKPGRGTPKGKLATLLQQFEVTIDKTLEVGLAARHALEMADQPFSPGMRSAYYMAAAAQLVELAGFCDAIAVHVAGPSALMRQERDLAQDGGQGA
jgi:hypothetical protein